MSTPVYFITGAGSGMGQLAARRALATPGVRVAALDVNRAGLEELGDDAENLLKLVVDVTSFAEVSAAAERVEAELGPVTRVMHAAAIMPFGLLTEQDNATVHRIMAINYGGLVNVTQATLPRMLRRRAGEFVSFSSMAGHAPVLYVGAYNASKFAVTAFTEVLYHENRNSGVRFACVCPPAVATPLLQQGHDTIWPRALDAFPPIPPEQVLDAIEKSLARGRFWVFPNLISRVLYSIRRWFPNFGWWLNHYLEGR